jgi:O-antigen/teichoic acid export membrane protein/SAM-dependent methyltransferase
MKIESQLKESGTMALVLSKELAWVTLGQVAAAAGGLAGVRWLTRTMDPSLYGEFGLALTGIALVQQSVGGPLAQAVMRFFSTAREEGFLPEYFRSVFHLLRYATWIIVSLGLVALGGTWLSRRPVWIPTVLVTAVIALLTGYNLTFEAIQTAGRNRKSVAWHQGLIQWLRPVSALALFACLGVSIESALSGYAIATFLVVCSQWFFIKRTFGGYIRMSSGDLSADSPPIESRMRSYAWPFASWGLMCWSQLASDRWLLELFRDMPAVGAYTVCYQLGYYPMVLVSTAVGGLITPILFKIAGSGDDALRVQHAVRANVLHLLGLLAVTLGATVGAILYGPALLTVFTSLAYAPFAANLPVLVSGGGLFACGQAASLVLLLEGQTSRMVGVKIGTAILGVLFNAIGAYFFGVAGAAWATLAFGITYLLAILRLTQRSQSAAWRAGRTRQPEIGEGAMSSKASASLTEVPPGNSKGVHLSSWVLDVLRDPLSKSVLKVRDEGLESEYGRTYPIVDGIYDLRLLTTQYGHGIGDWAVCQTEYENFAARARKNRRQSDYQAEQRGVAEVYKLMPVIGRCLDVGGGDGRLRAFLEPDQEYLSIDPFLAMGCSQNRPRNLKDAYPFIEVPFDFLCSLGEYLPLASESFSTVHMRSVLDHLSNTELALREAYRVLRRGGRLIVGLYVKGGRNSSETMNQRAKSCARGLLSAVGFTQYRDHHLWHPTYSELCDLTETCGFSIQTTHWQMSEHENVCYLLATR